MGLFKDVSILLFGDNSNKEERERVATERRIERYKASEQSEILRCDKIEQKANLLKAENDADNAYREAKSRRIEASKKLRAERQRKSEYHPNFLTSLLHNYAQKKTAKKPSASLY